MNKHSLCFCIFSFKKKKKKALPEVLPFHLLNIISQPLKGSFQPFHFTACPACFSQRQKRRFKKGTVVTVSRSSLFSLAAIRTHTDEAFRAPSLSPRHVRGILPFIHFLMHSN